MPSAPMAQHLQTDIVPPPAARPAAAVARLAGTAALAACLVAACGGGGGGSAAGSPPTANASAPAAPAVDDTAARQLRVAEKLYAGSPRVPEDFRLDPAPAGATGPVATVHLKNSDLPGASADGPRWELCSSDLAEALAWSELRASWQGAYADLVETSTTESTYEFVRVPRGDPSARLRHRVFRCDWLDRAGSDLAAASGPAGMLKRLPVTENALRALAEYVWQFTTYNNADHIVLATVATAGSAGQPAWRIEMARLTRAAAAGDCDRIERLAWTHAAETASGAVTRRLDVLESFRARRDGSGAVTLCAG